jgi:c-di-GMP phosphodiesterase
MGTLVSLAAMQSGSATIEELEQVIDRDVGLSVKLLRYINSAYIGMRGNITSIRQAVMMLGSRGVSRWALLVALTGGPSAPRELSVVGLTRARMCELLGSDRPDVGGDQLFTVGLLSVADALLEVPLETIVDELPLADEVSGALLRRDGPAGSILDAVVSYEQGEFDAAALRLHTRGIATSYRDALGWAVDTVAALA